MRPLFEVQNFQAGYGAVRVLADVSLTVEEGTVTALLGSNGAGKTTLMRAIAGLLRPDSGQILFDGERIDKLPSSERVSRGIALVPEGRLLFADLTVEENLKLGAFSPRARERTARRLQDVYGLFPHLAERRRQPAKTMSGGEQQMLALARGLMSYPRLLLLDEPSLGLAPVITRQLFRTFEDIRASGVTIFIVEQNVETTLKIADYGYVLEQGRIKLHGVGETLANDPQIRVAYLGM